MSFKIYFIIAYPANPQSLTKKQWNVWYVLDEQMFRASTDVYQET